MTEQEVLEMIEDVLVCGRYEVSTDKDAVQEFKEYLNLCFVRPVTGEKYFIKAAEQTFPDGLFDTILDRVLSSEDQLAAIQETISNPFWV